MGQHPVRRGACASLLAVLLAASGCAGADGETTVTPRQLHSGSIAKNIDLSGASFTVGSKEFTESVILGKITIYALRAAGAKVTDQTGLQGSTIVRSALENGDIDMYWGYAGTGWSLFLGHAKVLDGAMKQFRATAREDLQENDIKWMGPAKFGNQYGIARRSDASGAVGDVTKSSQLRQLLDQHPHKATFCGAAEFLNRKWIDYQRAYGADFAPPNVYQNAFALDFVNVAKGSPCNFAEVFTTDARIKTLDLTLLEDDKNVFLTQLASLVTRNDVYEKHPQLERLADRLGDKLTRKTMINLNAMVDIGGNSEDQAALHFLRKNGFIGA